MEKCKQGDIVKAKVVAIEKYGAFVKIDEEYSGLIHISEITDEYVRNITDFFEIGDIVNVKILSVSEKQNHLELSTKGINNDFENKKNKKIKETVFGFYLLKMALPGWIQKKMKEINKKI